MRGPVLILQLKALQKLKFMEGYIVLLRGINVGGHKIIKMADLRTMLNKKGFSDAETYIQSGNIVLRSNEPDLNRIAEKIKKGIADTFGFDVPVLVKSYRELQAIFDRNPFTEPSDIENKRIYFALLKEAPQLELMTALRKEKYVNEKFLIADNCVYLNYQCGAREAKISNNLIERKLKVSATSRNYRTVVKLLEMSKE